MTVRRLHVHSKRLHHMSEYIEQPKKQYHQSVVYRTMTQRPKQLDSFYFSRLASVMFTVNAIPM